MMAAEIQTDPEWGVKPPKVLFSGNLNVTWFPTYDVAPDGRFLMLREGESAKILETPQQIILVQNWFEELKRLCPAGK